MSINTARALCIIDVWIKSMCIDYCLGSFIYNIVIKYIFQKS